ncbi:hypothetical protein D3C71_1454460 [compost metagenome]
MRVRHHVEDIGPGGLVLFFVGGHAATHIVTEGDKVDGFAQRQLIFLGDRYLNVVLTEEALHIGRVRTAHLYITEEHPVAVLALGFQQVFRLAAQRIKNTAQQHIADLTVRHDLMAGFYRLGAGYQLMVDRLVNLAFAAVFRQTHAGERRMQRHVDLIEGQPVFDLVLVTLEHRAGVTLEELNKLAIAPTAILLRQCIGHFVMRQGDQRLNAVFGHLIEQPIVKCQPGFIRHFFVPLREDTRPGDRGTQALEAHLGKQRDIFRVTVVEIDRHILDTAVPGNARRQPAKDPLGLQI